MFIVHWVFDKLGYMPKIDMQIGKVDLKAQEVWPFPMEKEVAKKQVKKPRTRKPAAKKVK